MTYRKEALAVGAVNDQVGHRIALITREPGAADEAERRLIAIRDQASGMAVELRQLLRDGADGRLDLRLAVPASSP